MDFGGVQAGHDFVEKEEAGVGGERTGDFEAFAGGDGEGCGGAVEEGGEAEFCADVAGVVHGGGRVGFAQEGADADVLGDCEPGEGLGDLEGADHAEGGDAGGRPAGDVGSGEGDAAGVWADEAGDGGEGGGFAGAVGADQGGDAALRCVEVDGADGLQATEAFGEGADLKHECALAGTVWQRIAWRRRRGGGR